ncbi:hypothetical protein [Bradyrhizobium sp. SZCCHNS3053]|uniref:hypothetical protein n=1 Tax=Bradyrhizobium sp. SZCCHNS3053 TaxID=3057322 RepID=UPI002915E443|nr:hypothetical protein [Bradyrhizobium sp. SZCCHNS3053]
MSADDHVRERFTVDFSSMSVVYEGGFSVPIVEMFDRFDMETDDPEEAEELLILMPPDGIVVSLLMSDLRADDMQQGPAN